MTQAEENLMQKKMKAIITQMDIPQGMMEKTL